MKAPCEECLKQAICLGEGIVTCKDLTDWLVEYEHKEKSCATRIIYFEEKVWNKDIGTINSATGDIRFKDTIRDHYSALIVR